jgi:hypothetical protein
MDMPDNSQASVADTQPGRMTGSPRSKHAPRMGRAAKLRLLGRLHGVGVVTLAGSAISVVYDLDVFSGGATPTASGFLDGDFAAAYASDQDELASQMPVAAGLRLEDGNEVALQLSVVAADLAEIEISLTSAQVELLAPRR